MNSTKTPKFFVNFRKILRNQFLVPVSAMLFLAFPSALVAEDSASGAVIGTVRLVLGKAYVESAEQGREQVRSGQQIHVGDQILTTANGHVHVHFIDNALVSVRPDSQLQIVRYDYDSGSPEQSSVKFNLVEGVTRAISGDAAKSARQRFRLNTPIAAIGVRGTDFVVNATQESVRALVNEGAIVLAPFSTDCLADGFGPCASNAVELAQDSLQMIELDGSTTIPRLMPATHEREPDMMQQEVRLALAGAAEDSDAEDKSAGTDVYLENVTSRKVAAEVAGVTLPPKPDTTPTPPDTPVTRPDFTPEIPVSGESLTSRQLVWGRWANVAGSNERITLAYETARTDRAVTVGNLDYALFRGITSGSQHVREGLGVVGFELNSAQAAYSTASGVFAMQVNGGELDIDFDNLRFATQLDLNHSLTGDVRFNASGRVFQDGIFNSVSDTQRIAGAVTLDGREAGYFFEKQLENGGIQGLTLWDSQ